MADPAAPQPPQPGQPASSNLSMASPAVQSGARWFWWIAGLSLVNTVFLHSGAGINFVIGLGVTLLSDVAFASAKPIAFLIDAVAIGFFALMGLLATRGKLAAFYVGLAVYALDALIYVRLQDWMPVAFHALAFYFIVRGAMALRALQATA